jgi:putative inorganic carbon (HCO3(-)) transporter
MKFFFRPQPVSSQAILDLLIEVIYLVTIFLIPLWFSYWFPTYNIFAFNKLIVFKILAILLLLVTSLKIIFFPPTFSRSPWHFFKKYWLIPTIFIIGLSLTMFSSIDPIRSFYGTVERQAGLSSYLYYFLWFVLVSFNVLTISNSRSSEYRERNVLVRRIVIVAALSGLLVALYGALQFVNIDFLTWPEPAYLTQRAFSSLGQPDFLASWLLLIIPLSAYLFLTSRHFFKKFFWLLALGIQSMALFMTGSRGGVIALLAMIGIFLVYSLGTSAWTSRKKYLAIFIFLLVSLGALGILDYSSHGRVRQLMNINNGSLGARVNLYESAANAISERPWLGYGLESGQDIFIKYYTPDWGIYGDVGQSADRAHNLFLDILLIAGAWGLILYSGLYYFVFNLIRDNLKNNRSDKLSVALACGLAGYLFSLLFSFSFVSGETYFWLFLALLVAINFLGNPAAAPQTVSVANSFSFSPRGRWKIFIIIIFSLALALLSFEQINRAFRELAADYYFEQAYNSPDYSHYDYVIRLANYWPQIQDTNPVNRDSYNYYLADKLSEDYINLKNPAVMNLARAELRTLDQALPAQGYLNLMAKAQINTILHNFLPAQRYLSSVFALTPDWPPVYIAQGELAQAQEDQVNALWAYYYAAFNLPDVNDSRLNDQHGHVVRYYYYLIDNKIGDIYQQKKDYKAAQKYYQAAYQNNPADFSLLKKIADTYYLRGDLLAPIGYNQHGLKRNPTNYKWPLALAVLFHELGNNKQALNYINQALRLAPDNQQLQKLKGEYDQ